MVEQALEKKTELEYGVMAVRLLGDGSTPGHKTTGESIEVNPFGNYDGGFIRPFNHKDAPAIDMEQFIKILMDKYLQQALYYDLKV